MTDREHETVLLPSTGNATLIDVAKIAGVSPITVSRALNQPQLVRPETVAKVQAAVAATGYVKNMMAGALASNKSKLIAFLLPTIATPIFSETVQAASDELTQGGYQLLLGLSGYEAWREEGLVETILSRRPDGIILTGTQHTENTRKRLQNAKIPIVETWDMTLSPVDMLVGFSHEEIGRAIAHHAIEQGYRRIAVLTVDDPRGALRNQGLMAALAKHSVSVVASEVMPSPATFQLGRAGTARLLEQNLGLDLIVCSSDTLAHGALTEATDRGLRVPEDIGIMGFGDLSFAAHTTPPLSTVRVEGAKIGKLAARAIIDRIDRPNAPGPRITDTGFQLIHRGTT
jgi:LacI family gluconate utilization system Gnt-I transcriptional repressor